MQIVQGDRVEALLPKYKMQIDTLVSGASWETISVSQFQAIDGKNKDLYRSFYNVDNALMVSLLTKGYLLLKPNGKFFITECLRVIHRIKHLCLNIVLAIR